MSNIKDIDFRTGNFVDVFFARNIPIHVRSFLHGAQPLKESYKDLTVPFTEYTRQGNAKGIMTFSAERQHAAHIKSRYEYLERFRNNKHADVDLVERFVLATNKMCTINSHFHIGSLSQDYAQSRIDTFGHDDYNQYHSTVEAMDMIADYAQNGAILRIWYAHNACDLCGFMALLHRLEHIDCTVIELELPDEVRLPSGHLKKHCKHWEQFLPEELCIPVSYAKLLTKEKKATLSAQWKKLCQEDAEYRIYENNELKSADFEYLRAKAIPHLFKKRFSLSAFEGRLLKEEVLADLDVIAAMPHFIHRMVTAGDIAFLGHRMSMFSEDCWLKALPQ